jgi:O-antigen/teichoic acid export membrane protein
MTVGSEAQRLRTRLGRGVLWSLLATVFTQGSTFLANIIVARLLGQERFGQFAMVLSTLLAIAMIAQLGLGATATRHVAEYRVRDPHRAGRLIGLLTLVTAGTALAGALLMLIAAPFLAERVFSAPGLAPVLRIGALHVAFATIAGTQMGVVAGFEGYRSLARATAVSGVIYVAACSAGAALAGLTGAVTGLAVGAAAQLAAISLAQRREAAHAGIEVRYREVLGELNAVGGYAIPAAISGYISVPALWWGNAVLARQPAGFAELALYNAAWSFRTLVLVVPHNLNRVAGSVLYAQSGADDRHGFRRVFRANVAACGGFAAIAGGLCALLAGPLLGLYGDGFREGTAVLYLLLLSGLLEAVGIALYQLIQARKRMWLSTAAVALPSYGAFVVAATLLASRQGAVGLGTASIIAQGVMLIGISVVAFGGGHRPRSRVAAPPSGDAHAAGGA